MRCATDGWILFGIPILCITASAPANARPAYDSTAPIAYLLDMTTGTVLYEKGADKRIPPASMAKMMTVYVVFDLIQGKKLDPAKKFSVNPAIWKKWNNTGSSMFLKAEERVSVSDLLHGVVTLSGNDAAVTLAVGIKGSERAFVDEMNVAARRLGMTNSHFQTSNGWPDQGQTKSTARDLATLGARTVQDFPELYRQFYGARKFRWNGITQYNRNPILNRIAGADGLKTGHTNDAGYCFTGTATQKGRRLMMVLAGLPSALARKEESVKLLNWGFTEWKQKPLYKPLSVVATLPVQMGNESHVKLIAPHALSLVLPVKHSPRYKLFVRYSGPIKAPFAKGTQLAQLVVKYSDGKEQAMPLVAAHSVAAAGFFRRAWNGAKWLVGA